MKIEEYIATLPPHIISGDEAYLADSSLREIFRFAGLGKDDVFYHLGFGSPNGLLISLKEFGVKKAVGIDIDRTKISRAQELLQNYNADLRCQDVVDSDLSDATVILFWFSDTQVVQKMFDKFKKLNAGCKIITIFDPLPGVLPDMTSFPYLLFKVPFREAADMRQQLVSIFETECIDFTTAWEFAERYTKAVSWPDAKNDRFLTILQTVIIWINARNLGLSCTEEVPPPIKTYMDILRNFFGIEVEHLLER